MRNFFWIIRIGIKILFVATFLRGESLYANQILDCTRLPPPASDATVLLSKIQKINDAQGISEIFFEGGNVARVETSTPSGKGNLDSLKDVLRAQMIVYVKLTEDLKWVQRVLIPQHQKIRNIFERPNGDIDVELMVASNYSKLLKSSSMFSVYKENLFFALKCNLKIFVTNTFNLEILDARIQ